MKSLLLPLVGGGLTLAWIAGNAESLQETGGDVRVPHEFAAGTPAVASEVNDNFQSLEGGVNANRVGVAELTARTDALELSDAGRDDQVVELQAAVDGVQSDVLGVQGSVSGVQTTVGDVQAAVAEVQAAVDSVQSELDAALAALPELPTSERLVVVAPTGGDFTSVGAALASVSPGERTLVRVVPGTYDEAASVVVPGNVHLMGASNDTTLVRASLSGNSAGGATMVLEDGAQVSRLGVQNLGTGPGAFSSAIYAEGVGPDTRLENVRLLGNMNGGVLHRGVHLIDAAVTMRECVVEGNGLAQESVAMEINNDGTNPGTVVVSDCRLEARGPAIQAFAASLALESTHILATEHSLLVAQTTATVERSTVETTGGGPVFGLSASSSVFVAASRVAGGDAAVSGSLLKYVQCWKSNFEPVLDGVQSPVAP